MQFSTRLLYNGYRVFLVVQRPERRAEHQPPSSASLRMSRGCTSSYPLCQHRHVAGWLLLPWYFRTKKKSERSRTKNKY